MDFRLKIMSFRIGNIRADPAAAVFSTCRTACYGVRPEAVFAIGPVEVLFIWWL